MESVGVLSDGILEQALALVIAVRTELIMFGFALLLHWLVFGSTFPRAVSFARDSKHGKTVDHVHKRATEWNWPSKSNHADDEDEDWVADNSNHINNERASQAFNREDHRAVLRAWSSSRCTEKVTAMQLAQVVAAMQKCGKPSSAIAAEIQAYMRRDKRARDITYVNKLMETITKSLDDALVNGLLETMSAMGIKPDCCTYELLVNMHFTTRSFQDVKGVVQEMHAQKIIPTPRTALVLLKCALHEGDLDESLKHFRGISSAEKVGTVSLAPKHVMAQIVDLACKEQRVGSIVEELDSGRIPLSTELVNTMLNESVRIKDADLAEHVTHAAIAQRVDFNSQTFNLLIRSTCGDPRRISSFLRDMQIQSVECSHELVATVLASCAASGNLELADQLYALASQQSDDMQTTMFSAFLRFYASAGHAEKACTVYDKHLHNHRVKLDSKTEGGLLSCALKCGRKDIAARIVECSPADTAKHIGMIQNSKQKGNLAEVMSIFKGLEEGGAELTHSLYNSVLDACVECHNLAEAKSFMRRMVNADMADAISYNTMIKAYLNRDNHVEARAVMEQMQKAGCPPNPVTYNELISSLVRTDTNSHRAQVWDVLEEMKASGISPNKVTCSIVFRSLGVRSPQSAVLRAMDLLNTMTEPMDEVLLSSIVEACVRIGKPGLLTEKLEELHGRHGVKFNKVSGAHTFGSLIKAYGVAHDMDGAWRCWKEMRSQHVKPTSVTIGCMIEAIASNGDVDGGYELILQLLEDSQCRDQINAVVFGSVIKGFGRTKRMERVWSVFKDMQKRGIEPSIATFNTVIDACVRNNQIHAIAEVVQDMKKRRIHPNLITYSTIIKGHCQNGDMNAALSALRDLKNSPGLKADDIVYNTLLDGCASAGFVAEGERLFENMQQDGVRPGNYTLTVLVKLVGQGSRLSRAFELVELFAKNWNIRANSHVYSALLQACLNCKDFSRAVKVVEQSFSAKAQPEHRACQHFIRTFIACGRAQQAVGYLRSFLGLPAAQSNMLPRCSAIAVEDSFVTEAVASLLESEGAALVPALVADIRVERPKFRLDPAVERKVALVAARQCDGPSRRSNDANAQKHPWRRQ